MRQKKSGKIIRHDKNKKKQKKQKKKSNEKNARVNSFDAMNKFIEITHNFDNDLISVNFEPQP